MIKFGILQQIGNCFITNGLNLAPVANAREFFCCITLKPIKEKLATP